MHIEAGWACCAVSSAFLILLLLCCAVRSQRAHGKTEGKGERKTLLRVFLPPIFFSQLWKVSGIKQRRETSIRATSMLERNQHRCTTAEIDRDPANEGTFYDSRRSLGWMNECKSDGEKIRFFSLDCYDRPSFSSWPHLEVFFFAPRTKCFCLRRGFLAFTES